MSNKTPVTITDIFRLTLDPQVLNIRFQYDASYLTICPGVVTVAEIHSMPTWCWVNNDTHSSFYATLLKFLEYISSHASVTRTHHDLPKIGTSVMVTYGGDITEQLFLTRAPTSNYIDTRLGLAFPIPEEFIEFEAFPETRCRVKLPDSSGFKSFHDAIVVGETFRLLHVIVPGYPKIITLNRDDLVD